MTALLVDLTLWVLLSTPLALLVAHPLRARRLAMPDPAWRQRGHPPAGALRIPHPRPGRVA